MKRNWIGNCFIVGGLLLLAAALWLTMANLEEQTEAANASAEVLMEMEALAAQARQTQPPRADRSDGSAETTAPLEIPDYLRDPQMPMPEVKIKGYSYIGTVTIPALEISLPVISKWSYPRLQVAPCRYVGSVYTNDIIIMAHNYPKHFGKLSKLQLEDEVYFEDMAGNTFRYQVVEKEVLDGYSGDAMVSGDWDLTLFTCTVGGKSRVTIRCDQANS